MKNYGTSSNIILKTPNASYRFEMRGMREPGKIRYVIRFMSNFSTEWENIGTSIIDANCSYEEMVEIADKKMYWDKLKWVKYQKFDYEYETYRMLGAPIPDYF